MLASQGFPFRRARYVTRLVLSGCNVVFACPLSILVPSTLCRVFVSPLQVNILAYIHLLAHIKTMLKLLYDHFVVLYNAILPQNPSLASEHALREEQEIYDRTTKPTYRNVILFHLVLAAAGSLTLSDRQNLHCLSQETPIANIPCARLRWHRW
jgi:hypothetical protein